MSHFFNKRDLYLASNLDQMQNILILSKDQGLTNVSSGQVVETSVVAANHALMVQTLVIVTSL